MEITSLALPLRLRLPACVILGECPAFSALATPYLCGGRDEILRVAACFGACALQKRTQACQDQHPEGCSPRPASRSLANNRDEVRLTQRGPLG